MPCVVVPVVAALAGALAAAAPPLTVDLAEASWSYGPEDWKSGLPTQALGTRFDVVLDITRGGAAAPASWTYDVRLSDGAQTLDALQTSSHAGGVRASFDTDGTLGPLTGTPAAPVGGPRLPLVAGAWRIDVEAYSVGPLAVQRTFEGRGATAVEAAAMGFGPATRYDAAARAWGPLAGDAVPRAVLPGIGETGGDPPWLAAPMTRPGDVASVVIETDRPHADVDLVAWSPAAPLTGGFTRTDLPSVRTDAGGRAHIVVAGEEEAPRVWVVAALLADEPGGAASFVLGLGRTSANVTAVAAPEGGLGPLRVTVAPATPGVPVHALKGGAASLTSSVAAIPDAAAPDASSWQAWLDPTATRRMASPSYHLVAVSTDRQGAYAGHHWIERGLEVSLAAGVLGVDRNGTVTASLANLAPPGPSPALGIRATAVLHAGNTTQAPVTVTVPPGGTAPLAWQLSPDRAGSLPLRLAVDTGDLLFEKRVTADVLETDAYERATAPWYDPDRLTPGPGPAAAAFAVAAAAGLRLLVGRKR